MLGLVLIYFVGKAFYDLAGQHNRSQWGFAILGIVSYYAGAFLAGLIMAILSELGYFDIDAIPALALNVLSLPAGILGCWAAYSLLKKQWSRRDKKVSEEILDGDMID